MKILYFDTETTGLMKGGPLSEQPHIVQLGAILSEATMDGFEDSEIDMLFNPGVPIPEFLFKLHGINDEKVKDKPDISTYLSTFIKIMKEVDLIVGHNVQYDLDVIGCEIRRLWNVDESPNLREKYHAFNNEIREKTICTMKPSVELCKIPSSYGGYKWPKLTELYWFLFHKNFDNAHNAAADIRATQKCFIELVDRKIIDLGEKVGFLSKK